MRKHTFICKKKYSFNTHAHVYKIRKERNLYQSMLIQIWTNNLMLTVQYTKSDGTTYFLSEHLRKRQNITFQNKLPLKRKKTTFYNFY